MNKQVKKVMYIVIVLSLMVSAVIGVYRINVERNYKTTQIAVRYSDVLSIAIQTDKTVEEVLRYLKDQGATTLFVRENTVIPSSRGEYYNYKEQGLANYYEGYELRKIYPEESQIKNSLTYVETFNQEAFDNIYKHFNKKHTPIKQVEIQGKNYLEMKAPPSILSTVGVGFNQADLKLAADLGYLISPQVKSWTNVTEEGIDEIILELQQIENLGPIYFADTDLPGFSSEKMQMLIAEHGLGFVEFFSEKQKGFETMAKTTSNSGLDYKVIRLHTISDGEIKDYPVERLMDRYMLALTERNLRVFLFKMPNTYDIEADITYLTEAITQFKIKAENQGYTVEGNGPSYNLKAGTYLSAVGAGVGAILIFILLCDMLGIVKAGYILGAMGIVGYAALLKVTPYMGVKLMALFGAIVFPTYGVLSVVNTKSGSIKATILAFLKMCAISFGGALTIIGTLSRTSFGLGIDVFAGVKAAMLMPILLVVIIAIYQKHGFNVNYMKEILQNKVTYLALGLLGIGAIVLLIYTSRTGNTGSVSNLELQFRQFLDTVLGVRPRTKEFLIAHPIMIILLYYGYKEKYIPFLVLGVIGQISLVNTYAHIHTPILISLIRSLYGIVFGIVLGIILIYVIKLMGKVVSKWKVKLQ